MKIVVSPRLGIRKMLDSVVSNDLVPIGTAGDYVSVHSESGPIKPIDHFGITVENFSPDAALATIQRVVPGTKAEKSGDSVFVIGPEGVRLQMVPPAKK